MKVKNVLVPSMEISTITVLILFTIFLILVNEPVFAQPATENIVVHFENTAVLTARGINLAWVQNRIENIFDNANVTVTFCTGNPADKGHVTLKFDNSRAPRDGLCGRRITPGTRNTSVVYVGEIVNKFKGKMDTAATGENENLIALITAHEIAEVYLEDIQRRPGRAYVMETKQSIDEDWNDAQDPNLGWPATDNGSADLLRKRIENDKACRASAIAYHGAEDENVFIQPSTYTPYSGDTFHATVFGEGTSPPVPGTTVSFDGDYEMTDNNGSASFTAPYVIKNTIFDVTAWRDNFILGRTAITVVPPPVGGIVTPVNKLALLAPWIALAALIAIVAASFAVYWRRR